VKNLVMCNKKKDTNGGARTGIILIHVGIFAYIISGLGLFYEGMLML